MTRNETLTRINSGMFYSSLTGGMYDTTKNQVEPDAKTNGSGSSKEYALWGADNNYPQRLIDAVKSDPIASLLEKKIAFHYGRGLMFYKKEVDEKGTEKIKIVTDNEVPQEIKDFMRINHFKQLMYGVISDFEWFHSYPIEYVFNNAGKIARIKWQRMKNVRPEKRDLNTGEVNNYYLSGYWPVPKENEYRKVPAFNAERKQSGIYVHSLLSIDKDYFSDPAWHGITRWLYIASKIPRWILANIDNSMNIKYHVEIPWKYFEDRCPRESYKTDQEHLEAINKLVAETFQKMDQYLAGEQNVHKAFYSFINLLEDGKLAPGWKLTVLSNEIKDEAWLRAYGTAAMAMISGVGLSPSIAGSILPNGLGSGSGSDLREQFNFYIQVMTTIPREITLEVWETVKQINGWPEDLHLGYRDIVFQSMDQNKSGFAVQNEESPTNNSQTTEAKILSV